MRQRSVGRVPSPGGPTPGKGIRRRPASGTMAGRRRAYSFGSGSAGLEGKLVLVVSTLRFRVGTAVLSRPWRARDSPPYRYKQCEPVFQKLTVC
jgi:hypothetical protein